MEIALQCGCGAVHGAIRSPEAATRAICYCRDCQAYARFLGKPDLLDPQGGTDIVATVSGYVRITRGLDQLRCVSMTPRGPLRWYCKSCRTAIGNTTRRMKFPYAALAHVCLHVPGGSVPDVFGPVRARLNVTSALEPVAHTRWRNALAVARLARVVGGGRLVGRWRGTPFFTSSGAPISEPEELTEARRAGLYDRARL